MAVTAVARIPSITNKLTLTCFVARSLSPDGPVVTYRAHAEGKRQRMISNMFWSLVVVVGGECRLVHVEVMMSAELIDKSVP